MKFEDLFSTTQFDIFKILLVLYFGYRVFTNYRAIKLFAKQFHNLPDFEKEEYDLNKGRVDPLQTAGIINLPKPLAFICETIVVLFVLFMLDIILSLTYVGIFQ